MSGKKKYTYKSVLGGNSGDELYTDYAATTPLSFGVKNNLEQLCYLYGNPSSRYSLGDITRQYIERSRFAIRTFVCAPDDYDVIFTPSGSGSNTLATEGFLEANDSMALYSPTLHKSLQNYFKDTRCSCWKLKVNHNGVLDVDDLEEKLRVNSSSDVTPLVVVEYANSEIGTIQPVEKIIEIAHRYEGIVYLDCTGSIASIPINLKMLNADMIGFSGHKLGGLKGCGVLIKRQAIQLKPLIYGSQENGLVGGTENIFGIVSFGQAVSKYRYINLSQDARRIIMLRLKKIGVKRLIGDKENRLPNNFFFSIPGINGEELMTRLDVSYNMQVSIGSACNSYSLEPSPTLVAIGISEDEASSCIRMTFHGDESIGVIKKRLSCLESAIREIRKEDVG